MNLTAAMPLLATSTLHHEPHSAPAASPAAAPTAARSILLTDLLRCGQLQREPIAATACSQREDRTLIRLQLATRGQPALKTAWGGFYYPSALAVAQ